MSELVQSEFPLRIPVCAWCKPRESDTEILSISHGICPRHFQQIKSESQKMNRKRLRRNGPALDYAGKA